MPSSDTANPPGRPREFEIEEAVESAMQVFWSRGYHGTSLVDLIDGTGLSRGSLYKAFGDKRGLFLAALERYTSAASARHAETLREGPVVKVAIRATLLRYAHISCGAEGQRGCLLLATATEMLPHDAEVAECVRAMFERMRNSYAVAIQRGQDRGEIPVARDAQALAQLIVCLAQGMRAVGKAGVAKKDMLAVVDMAMALLD